MHVGEVVPVLVLLRALCPLLMDPVLLLSLVISQIVVVEGDLAHIMGRSKWIGRVQSHRTPKRVQSESQRAQYNGQGPEEQCDWKLDALDLESACK